MEIKLNKFYKHKETNKIVYTITSCTDDDEKNQFILYVYLGEEKKVKINKNLPPQR